jgi:hypothetical protein
MNKQMTGGVIRALIATIAGAVLAEGEQDLDVVLQEIMQSIASGDAHALVGAGVTLFAILWSMWTKLTEEKREAVVKGLTLKK